MAIRKSKPTNEPSKRKSDSRSNGISVITGMQGVGKSYNLNNRVRQYAQFHKRPVIVYDVNDEYADYEIVRWSDIKNLKGGVVRRVLPYKQKRSGSQVREIKAFDLEDLRNGFFYLLENFRNGCLVLDDFNSYTISTRKTNILSTLTRARHHGLDIIIVLQELGKVTKDLFANSSYFVMHRQNTSLDLERKKITNFPLFKIAENIVNAQFHLVEKMNEMGKFTSESEYKMYRSFYVEIDIKRNKIYGCTSKEMFREAIKKYLKTSDKYREVYEFMAENDLRKTNKEDLNRAVNEVSGRYMGFFAG